MAARRLMYFRAPLRQHIRPSTSPITLRPFHSSRISAGLRESDLDNPNAAQEVEAEKEAQLKGQKDGRNEWHDDLASDSESAIKADRGDMKDAKDSIQELEQETAKEAEKEYREDLRKGKKKQ